MHSKPFSALDQLVLKLVDSDKLPCSAPHTCPYLDGLDATEEGFMVEQLHPEVYHQLMDKGFRRSGHVLYRPRCGECRACVPLRIPVEAFLPSRSQRRIIRRNSDLDIRIAPPLYDQERLDLYQRYLLSQHPDSPQSDDPEGLENFLYTTCVDTIEVTYYHPEGHLIGVSILDLSEQALSSVYHFFDPKEHRRSIGVFSVLSEIELCRTRGLSHYYLGYWVEGSKTMQYKASYYPHEILKRDEWVRRSSP